MRIRTLTPNQSFCELKGFTTGSKVRFKDTLKYEMVVVGIHPDRPSVLCLFKDGSESYVSIYALTLKA